jgi:hypothetical protein
VTDLKLGKKPAAPRPKDITLTQIVSAGTTLPAAPVGFGHWHVLAPDGWGMLGNDRYGDCVWAGAGHETMMVNAMNGRTVAFTDTDALADYAAVTGFDPSDPATDQGTDVHAALDYRRHTGVIDAAGVRHLVGAYVALEPGNWRQLLDALYAFDFVAVGFLVPSYAMDQFAAGRGWSWQPGGVIEGGHYVPVVGRPHAWTVEVVTWGRAQGMGRRFFEAYCDEAYGVLSPETLNGGKTPEGLDMAALEAALDAL